MARAIRIKSISGALTVTVTGSAGGTPTVYTDDTFATTVSLPASVASGATLNMCFRSPDTYALSVKANGVEIAGDNNTTRPVDLESSSTLAAYTYDARLTSPIAGSSGPEGLLANLNGSYVPFVGAATYTYNTDGTVATATEGGIVTTYTYNADGTVHTVARSGVTFTYTYNADGTVAGVA